MTNVIILFYTYENSAGILMPDFNRYLLVQWYVQYIHKYIYINPLKHLNFLKHKAQPTVTNCVRYFIHIRKPKITSKVCTVQYTCYNIYT